jgi:UDP-2-acetamido-2-deoxy-ribo-hexuluronate aminotransferase
MTDAPIQFVDLQAQYAAYKTEIDTAIQTVMDHGRFIMGPEVGQLESALAAFSGAKHVIGCSSGTDALLMMMMADGIGPGDAIFVPSFTFTATAEVPLLLRATPVFVDADPDDFNMDIADLERRIAAVKADGKLTPRGILGLDLFGLPADYAKLKEVADAYGMHLWSDAAQSFGASAGSVRVGTMARMTATSFFPAKPLGCAGDGGAVFTDDDGLADVMRSVRAHGKGGSKYDIARVGLNARIDTLQAAILLAKLPHFQGELDRREAVSQAYDSLLAGTVKTPTRRQGRSSAWAQYTIQVDPGRRDAIAGALKEKGIPSAVYYPLPMHLQTAYRPLGDGEGSLPVCETLSGKVLSLPMHPFLTDSEIERIADAIKDSAA